MKYLTLTFLSALLLAQAAEAQRLDSWNTKARERSQSLNSAAITALSKKQDGQAIDLLMKAQAADPNDPLVLNTLGLALCRQEKYEEALDALKKSYKIDRNNAETLLNTGFVYYRMRDWDAAISCFQKALGVNSKLASAHALIGYANIRKGDFAAADDSFRKAIADKPNSQLAYNGLAFASYLQGNLTDAARHAQQAESIQSYHSPVLLLAAIHLLGGDKKSASPHIRTWTKATGKKGSPRSMTHLGYLRQHDFFWDPLNEDHSAGADSLLAASVEIPKDRTKRPSGGSSKARALLPAAASRVQTAPSDFFLQHEYGLLNLAAGNFDAAAAAFGESLKLCRGCKVDWLYLARAQALAGKDAEASYALAEFKRTRPNEKLAQDLNFLTTIPPTAKPSVQAGDTDSPRKKSPDGSGF